MNNNENPNSGIPFTSTEYHEQPKENVLLGFVGALIFGILGGIPWFIVSRMGYIAGVCGIIIILLALKGYSLFSKSMSIKGVIISIIISVLVIAGAEYLSLAFEVIDYLPSVSFMDAMKGIPELIKASPELKAGLIKDLAIGLILSIVCSFSYVKQKLK